jgi:hypothetical protein
VLLCSGPVVQRYEAAGQEPEQVAVKAESAFAAPLTVEQQVSLRQVQLAAAQEQPEQPPARA